MKIEVLLLLFTGERPEGSCIVSAPVHLPRHVGTDTFHTYQFVLHISTSSLSNTGFRKCRLAISKSKVTNDRNMNYIWTKMG